MNNSKKHENTEKKLQEYINNGTIWIEDDEYVGKASDGIIVGLGSVGEEERMERYLKACPTPDKW